ncbi:MAG: cytochrome c biogenesis protein ResB, partial [Pseudomonadota bacterium]
MTQKKETGFLQKAWSFIISIRLTIVLLFFISIACIIGTIVPQKAMPQEYLKMFSMKTYNFLIAAGCTDLFKSWWFLALMGAFTVNLIT